LPFDEKALKCLWLHGAWQDDGASFGGDVGKPVTIDKSDCTARELRCGNLLCHLSLEAPVAVGFGLDYIARALAI